MDSVKLPDREFRVGAKAYLHPKRDEMRIREKPDPKSKLLKTVPRSTFLKAGNFLIGTIVELTRASNNAVWVGFKFPKLSSKTVWVGWEMVWDKVPGAHSDTPDAKALQLIFRRDQGTFDIIKRASEIIIELRRRGKDTTYDETYLAKVAQSLEKRGGEMAKYLENPIEGVYAQPVQGIGYIAPLLRVLPRLGPYVARFGSWLWKAAPAILTATTLVITAKELKDWLTDNDKQSQIDRKAAENILRDLEKQGVTVTPEVKKIVEDGIKEHGEETAKSGGGTIGEIASVVKWVVVGLGVYFIGSNFSKSK